MSAFRASVLEWAGNDLFSRAKVAVSTLEEPLRTGDFSAVQAFNRQCAADGVRLSIFGKPKGGLVFDSLGGFTDVWRDSDYIYSAIEDVGAFEVMLGLPLDRVLAPYRRAKTSLALAALVGIAGMFFVFFALYRQRVRIRELARTEKFRREFVADVSHEIKTPLTGILGASEMLSEGGVSESQKPLLSMISKESTRLNALVQQILDLARLEREGEVLDLAKTDLVDLAREAVESLRPRAEAAGIAWKTRYAIRGRPTSPFPSPFRGTGRRSSSKTMASAYRPNTRSGSSSVSTASILRARRKRAAQGSGSR